MSDRFGSIIDRLVEVEREGERVRAAKTNTAPNVKRPIRTKKRSGRM